MKRALASALVAATAALIMLVSREAHAQSADCRRDAEALGAGREAGSFASLTFYAPGVPSESIRLGKPCAGATCKMAMVSTTTPSVQAPLGYAPDAEYGTSARPEWRGAPRARGSKCEALHMIVWKPLLAAGTATASGEAHGATAPAVATPSRTGATLFLVDDARSSEATMAKALADFQTMRRAGVARVGVGASHGLEDVAADSLQVLGRIVVDRASAQAYRLLREKLEALLGCRGPSGAAADPVLPATCRALAPLRLEDVAMSSDVLLAALAEDAIALVAARLAPGSGGDPLGVGAVLASEITPLVARPRSVADPARAIAIAAAIDAYVGGLDAGAPLRSEAERAVVAGVLAHARCVYDAAETPGAGVASCPFAAYADLYAGARVETQTAARALAERLVSADAAMTSQGLPDATARVRHAADALLGASCMLLGSGAPVLACPSARPLHDGAPEAARPNAVSIEALALLAPVIDAALVRDPGPLLVAMAEARHRLARGSSPEVERASLLLGALVAYGAARPASGGADASDGGRAHDADEARTRALESLTREMTQRTGRDGDDVWSLGGSLRALGGVRLSAAAPAFLGPLSLPLGIGFDHVARGRSAGFHLEISPVDLGRYVAYDGGGEVRTPRVADAIAPSVTFAAAWGRSIPLIAGVTVGYSPSFAARADEHTGGAVDVGVVLGLYVPLLDMN